MAFPTVVSITESFNTDNDANHDISYPAAVDAGDLLILFIANHNQRTVSSITGWTVLANQAELAIYVKSAVGDEDGGTVTVGFSSDCNPAAQMYRITGWGGTLATDIDISTIAGGTGDSTNSSSVTAGWGSDDNLWIAAFGARNDDATVSAYPTNYTNGAYTNTGGGVDLGATVGTARRELATDAEDPGAFTLSESEAWDAYTLVIKPSAAGGGLSIPIAMYHYKEH